MRRLAIILAVILAAFPVLAAERVTSSSGVKATVAVPTFCTATPPTALCSSGDVCIEPTSPYRLWVCGVADTWQATVTREQCKTIESLAAADDGVLLFNFERAVKILGLACKYTGASLPTITVTNGTADITTSPTCTTGTPTYTDVSADSDGTIAAGGFLDLDTGNPAAEGSWTMVCVTYKDRT
jgi:hypothetical protein